MFVSCSISPEIEAITLWGQKNQLNGKKSISVDGNNRINQELIAVYPESSELRQKGFLIMYTCKTSANFNSQSPPALFYMGIAAFSFSLSPMPVNLIFIEDSEGCLQIASEEILREKTLVQEKVKWGWLSNFSLLSLLGWLLLIVSII